MTYDRVEGIATTLVTVFIFIGLMKDDISASSLSFHAVFVDAIVALIMSGFFTLFIFGPIRFLRGIQKKYSKEL